MRILSCALLVLACVGGWAQDAEVPTPAVGAPGGLPEIKAVGIGPTREFRVNGKPFLPIMGWLQAPANLPRLREVGINTIAGYWWDEEKSLGAGETKNAAEYAAHAREAGLYFIPPYMPQQLEAMEHLARADNVLAWIHDDEPDLPTRVSDAEIVPGKGLIINPSTPLWKLLDGDRSSWSVLDPLEGATLTIKLGRPVTVASLSVWLTISPGLAVAKEVRFLADGREIIRATLGSKTGEQRLDLPQPATFQELTLEVLSTYPGEQVWGSLGEIEGFDRDGGNALLCPPRKVVRQTPEQVMAHYQRIKALDPTRPVLMTVTCFFINDKGAFDYWCTHEEADKLYPELLKAAEVPGFDVYPIYGWNRPEKLYWVSQGAQELRAYAGGEKPLYVWIETQAGFFGDNTVPVTGVEIRNEVYQAIIQGATAIGYFTHRFKPTFAEFGVPEENQTALREINGQLQRLAPVILSAEAKTRPSIELDGGLAAQCTSRELDGHVHIFALNLDMDRRSARGTISIEGLKAGTAVEVIDEGRTITAHEGGFSDDFAPLAVHVYRIKR